jgi:hypothetical protein
MEKRERKPFDDEPEHPEEPSDPTVEADEVEPTTPGPGDSEGARPEADPDDQKS